MMQKFVLGAYWNARREGLEECAENAMRFFAGLVEIDPLFAHWYEPGQSLKDALQRKVDTLDAHRLKRLLKGRNRIEELGFMIGLWNGAGDEEAMASLTIRCGCYNERIGNSVVVDLPYRSSGWVQKATSLLALAAEIWKPRWAGIMSQRAMRERDFDGAHPFVDWMVYVPRSVEAVPPPGYVLPLNDLGSIVVVQPNPPVGDSPEELPRIRRVESLLVN
jgi:hypothetical protein